VLGREVGSCTKAAARPSAPPSRYGRRDLFRPRILIVASVQS